MNLRGNRDNVKKARDLPVSERVISSVEKKEKKAIELKIKKSIKDEALQILLKLRASNGGNAQYGDIPYVVNKFHNMGYSFVTRGVLSYMLSEREKRPVETVLVNGSSESNLSSLTGEEVQYFEMSNEINAEHANNPPSSNHIFEIIST
jgi:hypothetical protein